ncbi:MAG: phosphatidate cytidylyltransferase [Lachnospiraceae bacterium]|nr:phosphatidate cytidylyltransferase [Lachnospiraceae bacterium]
MFKTRLISGIFLIVIALITIMTGGIVLDLTVFLISCIGYHELAKALKIIKDGEKTNALEVIAMGGIVLFYLLFYLSRQIDFQWAHAELLVLICVFLAEMLIYVVRFPKYHADQITAAFFSFFYAPFLLSFIDQTRNLPMGSYSVWLIFISAWGCDTCAYCVGVLIGKHKMTPILSPKKSVEGAIGGIVGAALIGALYAYFVMRTVQDVPLLIPSFTLISAAGALISMVGDLGASAFKRDHEIKDYGKLIPGHGGIMDRFDSIIFTAPVTYLLAYALLHPIL